MNLPATPHVELLPVLGALSVAAPWTAELPEEVRTRWDRAGAAQVRTLVVATRAGRRVATALEVHRPLTAYRKLVDVIAETPSDEGALLDAVEQRAWSEGAVAVKREFWTRDAAWERSLARGYVEMALPRWGAPVTSADRLPGGQVRWREAGPRRRVPYMRQTTDFTCGPAALQMALAGLGLQGEPDRHRELALWRRATTGDGCDPLGLGLAAADEGAAVRVLLSTTEPTLLELAANEESRELRRFIQEGFRAELAQRGLAPDATAYDVRDLRRAVEHDEIPLVLIDEQGMHADSCPHWIAVHDVIGDVFLAHDPWTDAHLGETYVDGRDLPIPSASLDKLAWYGHPAYRAAVIVAAQ